MEVALGVELYSSVAPWLTEGEANRLLFSGCCWIDALALKFAVRVAVLA